MPPWLSKPLWPKSSLWVTARETSSAPAIRKPSALALPAWAKPLRPASDESKSSASWVRGRRTDSLDGSALAETEPVALGNEAQPNQEKLAGDENRQPG